MFWATRPKVRALWTVLMLAVVVALSSRTAPPGRSLALGIAAVVVWLWGLWAVRWLVPFFVFGLAQLYRLVVIAMRLYVIGLAFACVWIAGAWRKGPLSVGRMEAPRWRVRRDVESTGSSQTLIAQPSALSPDHLAVRSMAQTSAPLAVVLIPLLWTLRHLPHPLPAHKPLPPGNYTLD